MSADGKRVAEYCRKALDLGNTSIGTEYQYSSLALCVIDSIYSIGVTYKSTQNTVERFCEKAGIKRTVDNWPPRLDSLTIDGLLNLYKKTTPEKMAVEVYQNRQRTSSTYGILKSEAVKLGAEVLAANGVQNFSDFQIIMQDTAKMEKIENEWREVAGQGSGISWKYFKMLAGNTSELKPDRMVLRFVGQAIKRPLSYTAKDLDRAYKAMQAAFVELEKENPGLNMRRLDYLVWSHESQGARSEAEVKPPVIKPKANIKRR